MGNRPARSKRRPGDRDLPVRDAAVDGARRKSLPLAAIAVCSAVVAGALIARHVIVSRRPGDGVSQPASSESTPRPSGLSPVAAAGLLGLPSEVPQTVEGLREETIRVCRRLADDLEDRPEAHALAALAYRRFGQTVEAVRCWERSLELDPDFCPALFGIASVAKDRAEYDKAAELLRRAIRLDPHLPGAHNLLVEVLLNQGKANEALPVALAHCEAFPDSHEGWFWLGQTHLQLKNYEEARRAHEKAIALQPGFTLSYHPLTLICARLGDRQKADEYRRKFAALKDSDLGKERDENKFYRDLETGRATTANTHLCAGNVYWTVASARKAEAHWVRAAAIDPRDTQCREALAACYEAQGRPADAARVREELLCLAPEDADQLTALVKLYLQGERNLPDAARHARKAVELEPTAANYVLLSAALEQNGDRPGALAAAERAVQLDPESSEPRQIYEFLKSSR